MQRPVSWWTWWVALSLAGCGGPPGPYRDVVGSSALKDEPGGNSPPAAVFRTTPPADPDGTIRGALPLGVTFNTCASTDPDEGDELKTTYDFDGDGTVDLAGHCRASRHFDAPAHVRVCVTDRQPGHEVCRSYVIGAPAACPRDDRPLVAEIEPNGYPDAPMGPFDGSVLISGTLAGDGDDYFTFTNACGALIIIQGRTFGAGGPGDCSADPTTRMTLDLHVPSGSVGSSGPLGSACAGPVAAVGVAPGDSVAFRVQATGAPPAYVLQVLMAQGSTWSSDNPLE